MNNTIVDLNRTNISLISGGQFCQFIFVTKDPDNFNFDSIEVLPGTSMIKFTGMVSSDGINYVRVCKDEYQQDSIVVKDLAGNIKYARFIKEEL
jgi:hypothetical protein